MGVSRLMQQLLYGSVQCPDDVRTAPSSVRTAPDGVWTAFSTTADNYSLYHIITSCEEVQVGLLGHTRTYRQWQRQHCSWLLVKLTAEPPPIWDILKCVKNRN